MGPPYSHPQWPLGSWSRSKKSRPLRTESRGFLGFGRSGRSWRRGKAGQQTGMKLGGEFLHPLRPSRVASTTHQRQAQKVLVGECLGPVLGSLVVILQILPCVPPVVVPHAPSGEVGAVLELGPLPLGCVVDVVVVAESLASRAFLKQWLCVARRRACLSARHVPIVFGLVFWSSRSLLPGWPGRREFDAVLLIWLGCLLWAGSWEFTIN